MEDLKLRPSQLRTGPGSGLDSDTLDGYHAQDLLNTTKLYSTWGTNTNGAITQGALTKYLFTDATATYLKLGTESAVNIAIGKDSIVGGTNTICVGVSAKGTGNSSVIIGYNSNAGVANSGVAIGNGAIIGGGDCVSIGRAANAGYTATVAIGQGCTAASNGSIALGAQSYVANSDGNCLSLGNTTVTRKIIHVAPGVNDDEAVIVSQLNAGLNTKLNLTGGTLQGNLIFDTGSGIQFRNNSFIEKATDGQALCIYGNETYIGIDKDGNSFGHSVYMGGDLYMSNPSGDTWYYINAGYISAESVNVNSNVTAQSFYQTSSVTKKKDISLYENSAVDFINKLEIVQFKYMSQEDDKINVGIIAENTDKLISGVNQDGFDHGTTLGLLLKAVQELSTTVNDLRNKLDKYES